MKSQRLTTIILIGVRLDGGTISPQLEELFRVIGQPD